MAEFKCDQCGKIFGQEKSLQQHMNDKHVQRPAEAKPNVHHPVHQQHPDQGGSAQHHKVKVRLGRGVLIAIVAVIAAGAGGYGAYAYFSGLPPQTSSTDGTAQSLSEPIGALGSTHIHADFAIFLDGEEITPLGPQYYVRAPHVHVEHGPGAGTVIHMHATNVPLGFFFRTLGMRFDDSCFVLDNGREYCSDGEKALKMYVRHRGGQWEENRQFHTYVFQDLDQILITYGNEGVDEIRRQQDTVTALSVSNSDRTMDLGGGIVG